MQVNNSKIDISIIVPVYGVEKYICRFMESVCAQTITNFRLVVVNDQSKDQSIDLIEKYKDFLGKRLVIINNSCNIGLSKSRNIGLDYVRNNPTKYVTFLDPDDWIEDDYLEDLYVIAEKNMLDLCISGIIRIEEDSNKLICKELVSMPCQVFEHAKDCMQLAYINPCAYSKLYRFEPIKDLRFRTIKRSEDTCYLFEALLKLKRIQFTNNAKYRYCLRGESLTGKIDYEKYESMHQGFVEVLKNIDDINLREKLIAQIFIRSSLGGVCRLSFVDMKRVKQLEKEEREYLDQCVNEWRSNRFLSFGRKGIGGKKEFALRVTAFLYKFHLFFCFVYIYYFFVKVIGIDVRA